MVRIRRFRMCEGKVEGATLTSIPVFNVREIKKLYRAESQLDDEEEWSDEDFFSTLDIQKGKDVIAVIDTEYETGTEFFVRLD
jgi:hypothetical protein